MSGGGVITQELRALADARRDQRAALEAAVLKAVTSTESPLLAIIDRVDWRYRNRAKVEGVLRKLARAGVIAVRVDTSTGGQGTRLFKLPEGR